MTAEIRNTLMSRKTQAAEARRAALAAPTAELFSLVSHKCLCARGKDGAAAAAALAWLGRGPEAIAADVRSSGTAELYCLTDDSRVTVRVPVDVDRPDLVDTERVYLAFLAAGLRVDCRGGGGVGGGLVAEVMPGAHPAVREAAEEVVEAERRARGWYETSERADALAGVVAAYLADVSRVAKDVEDVGEATPDRVKIPVPGTADPSPDCLMLAARRVPRPLFGGWKGRAHLLVRTTTPPAEPEEAERPAEPATVPVPVPVPVPASCLWLYLYPS